MPSLKDIYKPHILLEDVVKNKGSIVTKNNNGLTELPVGIDTTVLTADSTAPSGISWSVMSIGFSTVNTAFTQPAVGSSVAVQVSSNRWIQPGMYIYIETGGIYLVISTAGTNIITIQNLYTTNSSIGTTIGIAKKITPAGQRGTDGANAYTRSILSFVVPNQNAEVTISVTTTDWINIQQIIYIEGTGYYQVIGKTAASITAKNLGWEENAAPDTTIPSDKLISTAGIKGQNGINAYSVTADSFIIPLPSSTVEVLIESNYWIGIGQTVHIENAGTFKVVSLSGNQVELRNDGSIENEVAGNVVPTNSKVSPAGQTGAKGTNSAATYLSDSFIQPNVTTDVEVNILDSSFLSIGSYIYIEAGGVYKITGINSETSIAIKNLGTEGAANAGSIINPTILTPSGKPGIDGVDGVDGIDGIDGINGIDGIDGINGVGIDHISLTDTVGSAKIYTAWADTQETVSLGIFSLTDGIDGIDGIDGASIDHISLTNTEGLTRTYTIWGDVVETVSLGAFSITDGVNGVDGVNGTDGTDGVDGVSINHISLTDTVGSTKIYTAWADIQETVSLGTFDITDGIDGTDGVDGINGASIDHISLINTEGLTKTYTIWADIGETVNLGTFSITDGIDGTDGVDGINGVDGTDGVGINHVSLTSVTGLTKTYTIWGDVGETVSLGTFSITDGTDTNTSSVEQLKLTNRIGNPIEETNKSILYSKADGLYYIKESGDIKKLAISSDIPEIGLQIGNIPALINVNGVPGLPILDGSNLTNLEGGGHIVLNDTIPLPQQSSLAFLENIIAEDNIVSGVTEVRLDLPLSNLGDILYHNGNTLAVLPKGDEGQILKADSLEGLKWIEPTSNDALKIAIYDPQETGSVLLADKIAGNPDVSRYYGTDINGEQGFYEFSNTGHIIQNDETDMPEREKLSFQGNAVTVSDEPSEDRTIVSIDIPPASSSVVELDEVYAVVLAALTI
jgi:hypothetical protein